MQIAPGFHMLDGKWECVKVHAEHGWKGFVNNILRKLLKRPPENGMSNKFPFLTEQRRMFRLSEPIGLKTGEYTTLVANISDNKLDSLMGENKQCQKE